MAQGSLPETTFFFFSPQIGQGLLTVFKCFACSFLTAACGTEHTRAIPGLFFNGYTLDSPLKHLLNKLVFDLLVICNLISIQFVICHFIFIIFYVQDVNEDPGEDVALLSVSFEDAEATQVFPKLYLSPRIEQ